MKGLFACSLSASLGDDHLGSESNDLRKRRWGPVYRRHQRVFIERNRNRRTVGRCYGDLLLSVYSVNITNRKWIAVRIGARTDAKIISFSSAFPEIIQNTGRSCLSMTWTAWAKATGVPNVLLVSSLTAGKEILTKSPVLSFEMVSSPIMFKTFLTLLHFWTLILDSWLSRSILQTPDIKRTSCRESFNILNILYIIRITGNRLLS